ncbi:MAG: response regulator [Halobacteriovoraceae bacterium]|jgi:CheY-like chemotaxis protein|nr:response regulator [Halobacteriovoraceae bacterium]
MENKFEPHFLVVDDEPDIRELLEESLREKYKNVHIAEDGEIALNILNTKHIDIIISDYNMPNMNGFELYKQTREQGYEIPFIFLTAYSSKLGKEYSGQIDYLILHKPYKAEHLLKVANAACQMSESIHQLEAKTIKFCQQGNPSVKDLMKFKQKHRALIYLKKERLLSCSND